MIHLVPFLILALLVLLLLWHWGKRSLGPAVTIDEYCSAQKELDQAIIHSFVAKRIFDPNDMQFVFKHARPETRRRFVTERKALAISWLRRTQQQMARLMSLHQKLASYTYQPSSSFEFRLAVDYLSFSVSCHLSLMLVWFQGPFRACNMVSYTVRSVNRFCAVFGMHLANINPARLVAARPPTINADA